MFCSSLDAKSLDKQARTGEGARAPALDEQDDHVKESEEVTAGEAEFILLGHQGLPGLEGGLQPSVPGAELPVGAKFQGDGRILTGKYGFEDGPEVSLVGE